MLHGFFICVFVHIYGSSETLQNSGGSDGSNSDNSK